MCHNGNEIIRNGSFTTLNWIGENLPLNPSNVFSKIISHCFLLLKINYVDIDQKIINVDIISTSYLSSRFILIYIYF